MPAHTSVHPVDDKETWRSRFLEARAALTAEARATRDAALTTGALRLATGTGGPICAYVPVGSEPGGPALVSALIEAGHEVLLPVVPRERGPLEWARFDGSFARGPLGLREPTGPRLGVEAIGTAALVFVPGLAVDRRGIRLGRGAGYYDRSLPFARAPLVMLLHDDELVERLPDEPHDHPVTAALLPEAGLVTLGKTR
ncbi:MAG: 5-formyltetrahydrofolate cyclo-ligase [Pseudonocardia sp.]|nr:5-formyltetrahydrofolate cyclo-ligase [Pseudonocardia sp.]